MSDRERIKKEFGAHAGHYVSSKPHARGASLQRLVELIGPQADWQMLDIATGAGHTAFTFAPHVAHVWATDITPEMLAVTEEGAAQRGLGNITVETADAESLPYEDERFNLVTCRIAPHHFGDVTLFVREAARVLQPSGLLAVDDNIVPTGPAGDYVNAFEKFRDPSHSRCLTLAEWVAAFGAQGLAIEHQETLNKRIVFESWAARHDALMQRFLRVMLTEVSGAAAEFLQPEVLQGKTSFRLQEGIIIGRKG